MVAHTKSTSFLGQIGYVEREKQQSFLELGSLGVLHIPGFGSWNMNFNGRSIKDFITTQCWKRKKVARVQKP